MDAEGQAEPFAILTDGNDFIQAAEVRKNVYTVVTETGPKNAITGCPMLLYRQPSSFSKRIFIEIIVQDFSAMEGCNS